MASEARAAAPALVAALTGMPAPAAATSPAGRARRIMAYGWRRRAIKTLLWLDIFGVALRCYRNPLRALQALRAMGVRRPQARRAGESRVTFKYARAGGRWFWDLYSPGWPSAAFRRYIAEELNQSIPFRPAGKPLQVLLMAVTKACPLACEHCFEWDSLNRAETLSAADLTGILARFLDQGLAQVQFSGGEPLRRFPDLLALIAQARNRADTWIITSGFGLTDAKAAELKRAGLTGVLLSLDDSDPERHNRFRGSPHAFAQAEAAAAAARAQGLILGLSLCATRTFATRENLRAYADLGKRWGAGFIQLVEPKAVGHYAGQDVDLTPAQIGLLEKFHLDLSYSPAWRDYPSSAYQGYAQRREGCGGAARRYMYMDTDGQAQACPFCKHGAGAGDCRQDALEGIHDRLQAIGCTRYPTSPTS